MGDLEETAWQRGKAHVARNAEGHPGLQLGFAVIPGALAAIVAPDEAVLRVFLTIGAGVVGYCAIPAAWAAGVALRAPVTQRNELRTALVGERGATQRAAADHERQVAEIEAGHADRIERANRKARNHWLRSQLLGLQYTGREHITLALDLLSEAPSDVRQQVNAVSRLEDWVGTVNRVLRSGEGGLRRDWAKEFGLKQAELAPFDDGSFNPASVEAAYKRRVGLLRQWIAELSREPVP